MKFDRLDRRILLALQHNGRISNLELAEQVGLSPSPCSRRVRQLEDAGVIRRYVTLLDESSLGLKLIALIHISMDRHTPERFENFESQVRQYPEVLECLLITGQASDYLLKVIVPDMEYYQEFLLNKITRIKGVSDVHSSFIMRQVIHSTELPLNHLANPKSAE